MHAVNVCETRKCPDIVCQTSIPNGSVLCGYPVLFCVFFLFCYYWIQGNQLRGIRGLFNRSSKSSVDTNSGGLRKRSISDQLLRRTASAPAKGRKKTKMALSESMASVSDQKNGCVGEAAAEGGSGKEVGVEKRHQYRFPLTHRPISMPLDRLLQGQLTLCSRDKQHDMGSDTVIGGYFPLIQVSQCKYIHSSLLTWWWHIQRSLFIAKKAICDLTRDTVMWK